MKNLRITVNKKKGSFVNLAVSLGHEDGLESLICEIPDQLEYLALECAVQVAEEFIELEADELCGDRYERNPNRVATRYGSQPGSITLAGRKVTIRKPRVRMADGSGEVQLGTYQRLKRKDAMSEAVLNAAIRGVSCRDYEGVVMASCEGFGMKKSQVSREFKKASAEKVKDLTERSLDGIRFVVIFIDGVVFAGATMIVALGVTSEGRKMILGLRCGASENAQVASELLDNLAERGVDTCKPTLFVLDGSKALRAAVKRVYGDNAVIQRCRQHKKENIKAHLPGCACEELDWRLADAFNEFDYTRALSKLKSTERWLESINPDAAASLREGMEEILTITKLNVPLPLRKTLSTTNPIESAFSMVRRLTSRVCSWKSGDMRHRWCATGLLIAESRFKKIRGCKNIPELIHALNETLNDTQLDSGKKVA